MINRKTDHWTIVLLGKWNTSIFTPKWLTENVFVGKTIELEFVAEPKVPPRFTCGVVRLIPHETKLIISPTEISDEALQECEDLATTLLSTLQHTPIEAYGVNFVYQVESPESALIKLFADCSDTFVEGVEWSVRDKKIGWTIDLGERLLNLSAAFNDKGVGIEFNFHLAVDSASTAAETLRKHILELKNTSEMILTKFFKLELECDQ